MRWGWICRQPRIEAKWIREYSQACSMHVSSLRKLDTRLIESCKCKTTLQQMNVCSENLLGMSAGGMYEYVRVLVENCWRVAEIEDELVGV